MKPATIDLAALTTDPASAAEVLTAALEAPVTRDHSDAALWTEQFAASGKQGKIPN